MADQQSHRRLNVLSPLKPLTPLTPVIDTSNAGLSTPTSASAVLKKRNPMQFSSSPTASPTSSVASNSELEGNSPKGSGDKVLSKRRPGSLHRTRPSSIFGSLRSFQSLSDEAEKLLRIDSTPVSVHSAHSSVSHSPGVETLEVLGGAVLHHGEVQCAGGIFRKKNQYLVLTETHLVKFRTQGRAAEIFTAIPSSPAKAGSGRHSRMSSSGSLPELYPSDSYSAVRLNHIVAIHRLDDGRPYFSIEIAYMDGRTNTASAMTLQLHDPREAELWMSAIRSTAGKARLHDPIPFSKEIIEHTTRALDQERDYHPQLFSAFQVVQRATKSGSRSSSDDLAKLTSNTCILAVGMHKIHIIPLPKYPRSASSTSIADMTGTSHGIMTLTSLTVKNTDDKFELNFRLPLQHSSILCLASVSVDEIALCIRRMADYLRPLWLEHPFTWNVPPLLDEAVLPMEVSEEKSAGLDRTLVAYCEGYGLDPTKILYWVIHDGDDAPIFRLLPPSDERRQTYTLLELLAVMRALRYNESFRTISFANINLDILLGQRDRKGWDHVPWTTKSGEPLSIPDQENLPLLVQEVQALALKSKKLRRLDFSYCLSGRVEAEGSRDEGSGICEALFPLCAKQLTNVDWVILNGIKLVDIDVDFLYAAAIKKSSHFRAIELGGCGLMDRSMDTVLQAISHQDSTLESLNLSGNFARIKPIFFEEQIHRFKYIRRIDLSGTSRSSGPEPLIPANILLQWKLEDFNLSRTALNEATLNTLCTYLKSPQSNTLRELHLDQCQLTGSNVASLLHAMDRGPANVRQLELFASENRIEQHHEKFVHAIGRSLTPTRLTIQMLEYSHEHYFGELMDGLAKNRSLKFLDISKASLPRDASDGTSEALRKMFAKNQTLEALDISGEEAHLEVVNFGIGLNHALTGLKKNATLHQLVIEHQKLGLQGVSTLASVLEENRGLREIYCEHNDINLQAFTVLVNSLERNTTLLYLAPLDGDRLRSLKKVDQEIGSVRGTSNPMSAKATMKRTLGAAMGGQRSFAQFLYDRPKAGTYSRPYKAAAHVYSNDKEAKAVVGSLAQQWDRENSRLQGYLHRNRDLVYSIGSPGPGGLTSGLENLRFNDKTPRYGIDDKLDRDGTVKGRTRLHQYDDDFSSEAEELVDVDEKDDIQGALMMSKSLHM